MSYTSQIDLQRCKDQLGCCNNNKGIVYPSVITYPLPSVLSFGNTSGSNNIIVDSGQKISVENVEDVINVNGAFQRALTFPTESSILNTMFGTWTQRTSSASEPSYNRATWSPTLNLFATVSQQGRDCRIVTSPDGITWTNRLATGFDISGVTQVNLLCVNTPNPLEIDCSGLSTTANLMVGTVLQPAAGIPANCVVTLINSLTRFTTSLPVTGLSPAGTTISTWGFTCNKPNQLKVNLLVSLAVGSSPGSTGGRIVTAIDNTDPLITKFVLTSTRGFINSTCYVDKAYWGCLWCPDLAGTGYFVASSTTVDVGVQIVTSSDGITWIPRTTPIVSGLSLSNMVYSPTLKRVIVAGGQPGIVYSDDAINWTYVANPTPTGQGMGMVAWSSVQNQFLCLGFSSSFNTVFTSPDGITWTANTSTNLTFRVWNNVTYSPELQIYVAISPTSAAGNVAVSANGTYWEFYSTPELNSLQTINWVPELGIFTIVAQNGTNRFYYSTDGRTWIARTPPLFGFRGIAYSPTLNRFVLSGSPLTLGSSTCLATSANSNYIISLGSSVTVPTTINLTNTVVCNTGPVANTATDGFIYIPTCPGTPTGTPTVYPGRLPIVIDSTTNKLYFYSNGSWRDAGP